jgi:hypothetical protein
MMVVLFFAAIQLLMVQVVQIVGLFVLTIMVVSFGINHMVERIMK